MAKERREVEHSVHVDTHRTPESYSLLVCDLIQGIEQAN